jgi:hypothetical protein
VWIEVERQLGRAQEIEVSGDVNDDAGVIDDLVELHVLRAASRHRCMAASRCEIAGNAAACRRRSLESGPVTAATSRLSPGAKARMAAEVMATYAQVRKLMRRSDLKTALAQLRSTEPTMVVEDEERVVAAQRLSRAVMRTLPKLPVNSSCLMQSLTLSGLLARRGIDGTLVIGVQPGEEFGAHAWVELDGRALLEPGGDRFARLVDL